ncbi:RNA polymerase sigma factor region1.1 domain-containing protein [Microvirga sp. ACRRW]|uniref:RNA polymerase sigma factor region1.1 domain-containing protein n=1 Tax=Microvirga sp. ACRRW TaxID=2918205 RepID=UPI001EF57896|nr:RNA polymerase sigma factor region1.1 domain-containing protein [Microvirga sp. ACRRW]MCG7394300.1 RNA polymerase sigma factor region1.1 domain-containing protein [Microvirga sp. ACRRW]
MSNLGVMSLMQPALDSNTLDRLIALGRERGLLTTADLRASLPVETMSAEEIALIVVHLEETGVPVELEESLLAHSTGALPRRSAEIIPFPGPRSNRTSSKAKPTQGAKPALPETDQANAEGVRSAHWIIAAGGLLAFVLSSLIIYTAM